jgi:hypothetical protein
MANNSFKINKSVNFNPQPGTPANPVDGDFFYDSVAQSFAYYHNGSWANFDSVGAVAAQATMTGAQFTPAIVRNSIIKITGTGPTNICGFSSSFSGKTISIYNATNTFIVVEYQSGSEPTTNNRILTPSGGNMNIVAGEIAVFTYDVVTNRWLLVSISSQAGAQIPASTTNNGIVTLHRTSTTPTAPVVLCAEDLNAVSGVVGLDANKAASITPTGNVPALTLTGTNVGSGYALQINAGDVVFTGAQYLKWGFSTITGSSDSFIKAQFGITDGSSFLELTRESSTQASMRINCFDDTIEAKITTNISSNSVIFGSVTTNAYLGFETSDGTPSEKWRISANGVLSAQGGNRAIQNVLDPVNAQDAATRIYVNTYANGISEPNFIVNGNFDIWQRGTSIVVTAPASSFNFKYQPDRWNCYLTETSGGSSETATFARITKSPSSSAWTTATRYAARITKAAAAGASQAGTVALVQEIDRRMIPYLRNRKVALSMWLNGSGSYPVNVRLVAGTGTETERWYQPYTGTTNVINDTSISSLTSLGTASEISFTPVYPHVFTSASLVPYNTTTLAVVISFDYDDTTAGTDYLEAMEVQLRAVDDVPQPSGWIKQFTYAGGTREGEFLICQAFYEKSNNEDTAPGTGTYPAGGNSFFAGPIVATSTANGSPWPMSHPKFKVTKWQIPSIGIWDSSNTTLSWTLDTARASLADRINQSGFVVVNNTGGAVTPGAPSLYIGGNWVADAEI